MKKLTALLAISLATVVVGQTSGWNVEYTRQKTFVENLGQFDHRANEFTGEILYAADLPHLIVMFGTKGVSYQFRSMDKIPKEERQAIMEQTVTTVSEYKARERLYDKFLIKEDDVNFSWVNPNSNVTLSADGLLSSYFSYSVPSDTSDVKLNFNHCRQYETLTYHNLYPGIHVTYEIHPTSGLKYTITLDPGADPSLVKMAYEEPINLQQGNITIPTVFGDVIDHKPVTFYQNNPQSLVGSSFIRSNDTVSFAIDTYDSNETLVIDPWTQAPNFNLNWDCIWELDHDAAGNVYVIGGVDNLQLLKYNAAGVLQWTHTTPYDTTAWLGTMATDDVGNTYVTNGTGYMIQKINTSGGLVWNNNSPSGPGIGINTEFWNISFNCDQTKLLIGGSGGFIHGRVYDVNMNTGNVNSSMQLTVNGSLFSIPIAIQEIRAMCSAPNGKYYFVSLDTIGYFSDNLSLCSGSETSLIKDNHGIGWGYKAENWRYNNTGIKAIRVNENAVYVNRGNQIQKRSLVDFSILATAPIPNGNLASVFLSGNQSHNAGIDIDDCGNVYVGSTNGVYKFDQNLTQLALFATPSFKVWDVQVTPGGNVIACGGTGTSSTGTRTGGVQLFNAGACNPIAITCCNTTFCSPGVLCENAAPVLLTTETPGGTWSGPGINASGVFDPSIAGVGNHLITYTLPCGSESMIITVISCNEPIAICEELDGTLTASGGNGVYSWYTGTSTTTTTNITNAATCAACGGTAIYTFGIFYNRCENSLGTTITSCSQSNFSWSSTPYANGNSTAAPASYPILVIDGVGDSVIINSASALIDCAVTPLYVSLEDYSLTCLGGDILCEWTTLAEQDNAYFYIEKMLGNTQFEVIATIPATGNSTSEKHYQWVDRTGNETMAYYRLHQVDIDGTDTKLATRAIDCSDAEIRVNPNPFRQQVTVELGDLYKNVKGQLSMYNALGSLIFTRDLLGSDESIVIETSGYAPGMYYIEVRSDNAVQTVRLVKQ